MNFGYELSINPCASPKSVLRQHPEGEIGDRPRQLIFSVIATDLRPQGAAFLVRAMPRKGMNFPFLRRVHTC